MNRSVTALICSLWLASPARFETRAADTALDAKQVHPARGVVRKIAPDRREVVIRHEAITNYMPAMTMEFIVRDTNELSGVVAGDTITFLLTTTGDTHWIDSIRKVAGTTHSPSTATPRVTSSRRTAELKPGDLLPDSELLAEDGRRIRFSNFRGKALAFTFFFTRCPLPDYCPRMGNNFAKARELVLAGTGTTTNWQFLTISFDPDFDKPAVLASYANSYRAANADRWLFAAAPAKVLNELAPRLDLMIHHDAGGGISHNLRTVVLDPQGRIYRQFDGNGWTPQQLTDAVLEAARVRAQP
jgi:protein SCO1/2